MRTRLKVALVPLLGCLGTALTIDAGYDLNQVAGLFAFWSGLAATVIAISTLRRCIRGLHLVKGIAWIVLSVLIGAAAARRGYVGGAGVDVIVWLFVLFGGGIAFFLFHAFFGSGKETIVQRHKLFEESDFRDESPKRTDIVNWPTPGAHGHSLEARRWKEHL